MKNRRFKNFIKYFKNIYIIILLFISVIGSSFTVYFYSLYAYSPVRKIANFISSNSDDSSSIFIAVDDVQNAKLLSSYLDQEVYLIPINKKIYSPPSKKYIEIDIENVLDESEYNKVISNFNNTGAKITYLILNKNSNINEILDTKKYKRVLYKEISDINVLYWNKSEILKGKENSIFLNTDKNNFEIYWRPLNQCEFLYKDDGVIIRPSNHDPYFESKFNFFNKNVKKALILIEMYSEVPAELSIYYNYNNGGYSEELKDTFFTVEGDNYIINEIADFNKLSSLRIDPINLEKDCLIKSIKFYKLE